MERSTIHLLHKRGKSLREIADELGRSKTTIARALSEPVDRRPASRRRASNVDPWRGRIAVWLRQGLNWDAHARAGAGGRETAVWRWRLGVAGSGAARASGAAARTGRG
ncbi:MAG: helix-turn-helix domain-containing protein [Chloroflexi bacterium]|nr:helix-turn-helix domain-containing protein [Chloroflexota bacterium]